MWKLLLATVAAVALIIPAKADVILNTNGSAGTGDNVIFDSEAANGMSALGHLNDPNSHNDVVRFTDFASAAFTSVGATSGNDIKITGATDLGIQVFDQFNTTLVDTTKQVFSLSGTGMITLIINAVDTNGVAELPFSFSPFAIGNNQSFFILTVANGETMTGLEIKDTGGTISDFEHYRIDVAPLASSVPEMSTWFMMLLGFAGVGLLAMRRRREGGGFRFV